MFKHMAKSRKRTLLIAAAVFLFCVAVMVAMNTLMPPSFFADTSPLRADGSEVNTPFFFGAVIALVVILWALFAKKRQQPEAEPQAQADGGVEIGTSLALAALGDGHMGASAGGPAIPRRKPPAHVPIRGSGFEPPRDPSLGVRPCSAGRKPEPPPAKPQDVAEKLRLLEAIARLPDVRFQKVLEARQKIADGELETPEAIDETCRRLLEELGL